MPFSKHRILLILIFVIALIGGVFIAMQNRMPQATTTDATDVHSARPAEEVIGLSVEGRDITAYRYGTGDTQLVFVGGIHGGYEWNSVLLAYTAMDYLATHPKIIPANITVTIIPVLNPDGLYKIIQKEGRFTAADVPSTDASPGRFNAHGVDLNRNFDCRWSPKAVWREHAVGAGSGPFSEPEALAIKNFMLATQPSAVVFWHSQSGAVYSSQCEDPVLPETLDIMRAYAKAAGYASNTEFSAYTVTGDAEGWLASIGVPTLTVELTTHEVVEWDKNLAGINALFGYYTHE